MPRLDTKLEAEGAEFLVLGQLLIHRIASYKTYTNMPGYDLVATHPTNNTSARIQVKSRWRTGAPGFLISNFACDFVVVVRLNRGNKKGTGKVQTPEYFVFPTDVVKDARLDKGWHKVLFKNIPDLNTYRDRWDLIDQFLAPNHTIALSNETIETIVEHAIRFDGYRYIEENRNNDDFSHLVEPRMHSLSLAGSLEENWATFFALQRYLHKWGGEQLPIISREWSCYLMLFLHLNDKKVPPTYCSESAGSIGPEKTVALAEAAAEVRRYFAISSARELVVSTNHRAT